MPIKVFRSDQLGAPTVNGVAGSLITALDAVLVDGYGQVNVDSITRAGAVATVTTASEHGLATHDVCLIGGATETEYNGEFVVTVLSSTSFTIAIVGEPATPATGAIVCRRAPAGFTKPFAATNQGVYRAIDSASRRHFMRVIDSGLTSGGAREARLLAYEDMTAVDTGTGLYPTTTQLSNGFIWVKSSEANATARAWMAITDGKTLYWFCYHDLTNLNPAAAPTNSINASCVGFGDIVAYRPGDVHANFVTGQSSANAFSSTQSSGLTNASTSISASSSITTSSSVLVFARPFTGVADPKTSQVFGTGLSSAIGGTVLITYPHAVDNGFYMTPVLAVQSSPAAIRGRMPGLFEPLHSNCFPNTTVVENVVGYPGRRFMMAYGKYSSSSIAAVMLDITGPWDS